MAVKIAPQKVAGRRRQKKVGEDTIKQEKAAGYRRMYTIIRTRQRNWIEHIMTGDSLHREIIEGRMDCK